MTLFPQDTLSLQSKIASLKEEKEGLLLVHNYQLPEIQEIADYLGDSLELCLKAASIEDSKLIVFCGVDFMAETAAILNPSKKVVLPTLSARCPMAAMLPASVLREKKEIYPDAPVVLYVNTLAETKAEADVVCTSANAAHIIGQLESDKVIFGPDVNLAFHVSRLNPDKKIIPVPDDGYCYVHRFFGDGEEAFELKKRYPDAELLVHPECNPEFQIKADYVLSTGQMYSHCQKSEKKTFIIATEVGLVDRLRREIPGKTFIPAMKYNECAAMKRITLENTYKALRDEKPVIDVPIRIAERALIPIKRMIEMTR